MSKSKKIKSNGNQFFNVPNTEEGKQFLGLMKKFLNRPCSFKREGRATDRKAKAPYLSDHRLQSSMPLDMSDWWAVYIHRPNKVYKPFVSPF